MTRLLSFLALAGVFLQPSLLSAQTTNPVQTAQALRKAGQPVAPLSDTLIVAEAEEFQVATGSWKAQAWGTNYYAATFANSFLSRKAYLGAPPECERSTASLTVQVPKAGKYLALVRYEACYRFETQFKLQITQGGKVKLDRLYGARDNLKIWAFHEKLKKEVAWPWGAVENIVWEGHDAWVELDAGVATLILIADKQPEPAAKRNVDVVVLTSDEAEVKRRIEKEDYLPLDGLLTQAGDVFVKVHNASASAPVEVLFAPCVEHSPYWIHQRSWKPKTVTAPPGKSTDWQEVGSLLDTLNDGQWQVVAKVKDGSFALEFGVKQPDGTIKTIRRFDKLTGSLTLAYDADTRYTLRIRPVEDVLYDLVDYLKKHPVDGVAPKRTLIYGYTFAPKPGDAKYTAALDDFLKMMGATALGRDKVEDVHTPGLIHGYIDVRGVPTDKLQAYCQTLQKEGRADKIAVVSLGDEIGLEQPSAKDHDGFRAWLKAQNLKPADVVPAAGDWSKIEYNAAPATAKSQPRLFYYSKIYSYRYGIQQLKQRTDILKKYLPNAGIGANFSPHHGALYLGSTHQWISVFREGGMTMPWGEDYIWQVPVGSQQMNAIMVDMFRCGIRNQPGAKIQYYVMPHTPGNTPKMWQRQFYLDLAHGVKIFNLFEFRPVQAAYTENHCSDPAMYQQVRKTLHELGKFEDIVQDGTVLPGWAAMWCSETADVWGDDKAPFAAARRTLYLAVRHAQIPLDFVVEGDDLKPYQALYLTDLHVSRAASKAIAAWVEAGGRLYATAGAGMFDEFDQPNEILRELLGVEHKDFAQAEGPAIQLEKQDLPFAAKLDTVTWHTFIYRSGKTSMPVFGLKSTVQLRGKDVKMDGFFQDGTVAIASRKVGKGQTMYVAFLPGLTFLQPAMEKRPVDRGATDDTMAHLLPSRSHHAAGLLIAAPLEHKLGFMPVFVHGGQVETTVIRSKQGVVIPLIEWAGANRKQLHVSVRLDVPTKQVSLASGRPVMMQQEKGYVEFIFDLDVADALILR
jgi:hypothetical protein